MHIFLAGATRIVKSAALDVILRMRDIATISNLDRRLQVRCSRLGLAAQAADECVWALCISQKYVSNG
ncbi:hypothetical protein HD806DRAFT_510145 [Xylariaceae sp. AK1471]|nr:hypothetical protein HD806DRAFT_510145 [Xylariaceae sp. AK1471]